MENRRGAEWLWVFGVNLTRIRVKYQEVGIYRPADTPSEEHDDETDAPYPPAASHRCDESQAAQHRPRGATSRRDAASAVNQPAALRPYPQGACGCLRRQDLHHRCCDAVRDGPPLPSGASLRRRAGVWRGGIRRPDGTPPDDGNADGYR